MTDKHRIGNVDLARRIRDAGRPIYIREDDPTATDHPTSELLIYQVGGIIENVVFDLSGGAGFCIDIVITANRPQFAISHFELVLPWNTFVHWLPDPREGFGRRDVYSFGGTDALEFERRLVLNHHANVCRTLRRGSSVRGLLLGRASEAIPNDFWRGATIPGFVIVVDQFFDKHMSPIELRADRSRQSSPRTPHQAMRKKLFASPDPVSQNACVEKAAVEVGY
jgi:hypothetical protein